MLKSLGARVAFAPKDFSDAKELSDELGFTTARSRSISRPRFASWGAKGAPRGGNVTVSEQRRALLLPQEVKELGTEAALIFCEGVRPIRAKKIRYFQDRRFRTRLLPPPQQPVAVNVSVREAGPASDAGISMAGKTAAEASATAREGTAEDVARLDSLQLTDFAADFSLVQTPTDRSPTDGELHRAVDQFLTVLSSA
jgi:type IV secretion system protein VirD4